MSLHDADIAALNHSNNKLLLESKEKQDKVNQENQRKSEADKVENVRTLDDMKKLLTERGEQQTQLEQTILDNEKKRVEVENSRTVGMFVDKFINENVVTGSLVRDAIKRDISSALSVRQGKVVEINSSSELTGRTGDQVLSDAKTNTEYSRHLIVSRGSGGDATGGDGDGVSTKTITREEYNLMPPIDAAKYFKDGGVVGRKN